MDPPVPAERAVEEPLGLVEPTLADPEVAGVRERHLEFGMVLVGEAFELRQRLVGHCRRRPCRERAAPRRWRRTTNGRRSRRVNGSGRRPGSEVQPRRGTDSSGCGAALGRRKAPPHPGSLGRPETCPRCQKTIPTYLFSTSWTPLPQIASPPEIESRRSRRNDPPWARRRGGGSQGTRRSPPPTPEPPRGLAADPTRSRPSSRFGGGARAADEASGPSFLDARRDWRVPPP